MFGEPSEQEQAMVNAAYRQSRALHRLGAPKLAQMDWERLFSSASPPGAPTPSVAKATLTRDSRRRWELARKANRSGVTPAFRLAKAIMERKA